jgi:hypothetical protein
VSPARTLIADDHELFDETLGLCRVVVLTKGCSADHGLAIRRPLLGGAAV